MTPQPENDDLALRLLLGAEADMRAAAHAFDDCTLEELTHIISDVAPGLAAVAKAVSDRAQDAAGAKAGAKTVIVSGIEWERSQQPPKRTGWRTDELKSAVLDSRLVDDDGVVADESPLDKIVHVWNLGAPRSTALAARGIDGDQFCHVAWPDEKSWKFVPAAKKKQRRK